MVASQRDPAHGWSRGWVGGGSPHHYPVRSLGLGVCLTMGTHYNHTTRASITSKHVPIVERLVGRHSPTEMGVSGLASRPEPWRPTDNTTRTVINSKHESIVESRRRAMQAAITLPVDSFRLASARGIMATRHYTTSMSITSQHVSIVEGCH
jgi:hypothetical protein